MTGRRPCPAAPGSLEDYAARFDDLFGRLAQRRGFRDYLAGLLAPRDRNKTLTALAGAEPVAGAQHAAVQRLQFFLSESRWDPELVNARRLELLAADPATAPHGGGVLVVDDSGDRKDGVKTAHVGHQYLGRYGKTDNGVVTVTTVWADERVYYPVHAVPYTPARHFAKGKNDPAFRTKLKIGAELAVRAKDAGFTFRAVAADSAYGDQDGFRGELADAGLPFVMALKPRRGTWAYGPDAHTPVDAARELWWDGPDDPGDWQAVTRAFRDGHTETWFAADASLGWWGPDGARRLVVATADPATLPAKATWYLVTNLPRPGGPREAESPHPAGDLAEIVRIYGIRNWIEQSYKQVKDELGWADFQVRSDVAIRRHQALVNCAFSFCWDAWFADTPPQHHPAPPRSGPGRGERGATHRLTTPGPILAPGTARDPRLAHPIDRAAALVAGMVRQAPAAAAASPDDLRRGRLRPAPLHPELTNYRYSFRVRTPEPLPRPLYLPAERVACTPAPGGFRVAGTMEFRPADDPLDRRRIGAILRSARAYLPGVDWSALAGAWVGPRPVTADGLPIIGATRDDGLFVAGGHGMWGMTLGPATGRLLARHIATGRPEAALAPFDPLR